jgi:hypothetical protein
MSDVPSGRVLRYAGWSAYLSVGLAIVVIAFTALFYALEAPRLVATGREDQQFFGNLSDIAALFQYLFMLPLTVALYQLASSCHRGLAWAAMALGIVGLLLAVIEQALLVTRVISFSVNVPLVLAAFTLIGAWMVLANHLGRSGGTLPVRLTWLGELMGAAFVLLGGLALVAVLTRARNPIVAASNVGVFVQQHPVLIGGVVVLAAAGSLVLFFGNLIWLIWLGRQLLASAAASVYEPPLPHRQVAV